MAGLIVCAQPRNAGRFLRGEAITGVMRPRLRRI